MYTRKKFTYWSEGQLHHDKLRLKALFEGLQAIKEIRILRRQEKFINSFIYNQEKILEIGINLIVFNAIPRIALEFLAVLAMSVMVVYLNLRGFDNSQIITTLSLFAVAAFRTMPGLNKLTVNLQNMKYGAVHVDFLYEELSNLNNEINNEKINYSKFKDKKINSFKEIQISKIRFKYKRDKELKTLNDISLSIKENDTIGIIGPSGSGKSTLINLIMGLFSPDEGEILLDGVNINHVKESYQKLIGYVSQNIYLSDDSIRNNIAFGINPENIDNEKIMKVIKLASLEEFIGSLPDRENTIVGETGTRISGGEKQRIGIARALYNDPKLLVLDEATSSLDTITEENIISSVINNFKGKITMIIISHRKSQLKTVTK